MAEKILIAYYSKTGHTKKAAEELAKITGGTLFEIKPQKSYPESYFATIAVAKLEQLKKEMPALSGDVKDWECYDTVLLGYPIWWFTCPQVIKSFITEHDFTGKKILPFCTHGGSGPKSSAEEIRKLANAKSVGSCLDAVKNLNKNAIAGWLLQK